MNLGHKKAFIPEMKAFFHYIIGLFKKPYALNEAYQQP